MNVYRYYYLVSLRFCVYRLKQQKIESEGKKNQNKIK